MAAKKTKKGAKDSVETKPVQQPTEHPEESPPTSTTGLADYVLPAEKMPAALIN